VRLEENCYIARLEDRIVQRCEYHGNPIDVESSYVWIAPNYLCTKPAKLTDDVPGGSFAVIADVRLVSKAKQHHSRTLDSLALSVEEILNSIDYIVGHSAADLLRQLDKSELVP